MFKTFLKNKKAQNTAEYALLIALVVAGIIAMQTFAQRALQARVRDASVFLTNSSNVNAIGTTNQYEPYYLQSNYQTEKASVEETRLIGGKQIGGKIKTAAVNRERAVDGFQESTYDPAQGVKEGL